MSDPKSATFLVVDDSRLHHQIYNIAFSRGPFAGSTLLQALDGREGYELFASHPEITMVFLDINMPVLNGLEFLEKRKEEKIHLDIPVVLVSTESSPEDEQRGIDAGAAAYLRKPFQPVDLEKTIKEVLGR